MRIILFITISLIFNISKLLSVEINWVKKSDIYAVYKVHDIFLDESGIYVTGNVLEPMPDAENIKYNDGFIYKYDLEGNIIWKYNDEKDNPVRLVHTEILNDEIHVYGIYHKEWFVNIGFASYLKAIPYKLTLNHNGDFLRADTSSVSNPLSMMQSHAEMIVTNDSIYMIGSGALGLDGKNDKISSSDSLFLISYNKNLELESSDILNHFNGKSHRYSQPSIIQNKNSFIYSSTLLNFVDDVDYRGSFFIEIDNDGNTIKKYIDESYESSSSFEELFAFEMSENYLFMGKHYSGTTETTPYRNKINIIKYTKDFTNKEVVFNNFINQSSVSEEYINDAIQISPFHILACGSSRTKTNERLPILMLFNYKGKLEWSEILFESEFKRIDQLFFQNSENIITFAVGEEESVIASISIPATGIKTTEKTVYNFSSSSILNLPSNNLIGLCNFIIYDINGKLVDTFNKTIVGESYTLHIEKYKKGLYSVILENGKHQSGFVFIKE